MRLLKAIDIDSVLTPGEAFGILDHFEGYKAPFDVVKKDLCQLVNSIAEEGYDKLIQNYNTPAEKIVKMLMNLKI